MIFFPRRKSIWGLRNYSCELPLLRKQIKSWDRKDFMASRYQVRKPCKVFSWENIFHLARSLQSRRRRRKREREEKNVEWILKYFLCPVLSSTRCFYFFFYFSPIRLSLVQVIRIEKIRSSRSVGGGGGREKGSVISFTSPWEQRQVKTLPVILLVIHSKGQKKISWSRKTILYAHENSVKRKRKKCPVCI